MEEPMDTLVRDPEARDREEFTWDDSVDALTLPVPAEKADDPTPTYLHPAVVVVTASGYAWTLLVFWAVFFGYGYMGLSLVVATLISGVMLGMMAVGSAGSRDVTPWQRHWRSFQEFLDGDVQVWGGRIPGRDAFLQLAGMSWCLAGLATVFGVIIELSR